MKAKFTEDAWSKLAKELHVSRKFAKDSALLVTYGGGDPWLRHLVMAAICNIVVSEKLFR